LTAGAGIGGAAEGFEVGESLSVEFFGEVCGWRAGGIGLLKEQKRVSNGLSCKRKIRVFQEAIEKDDQLAYDPFRHLRLPPAHLGVCPLALHAALKLCRPTIYSFPIIRELFT